MKSKDDSAPLLGHKKHAPIVTALGPMNYDIGATAQRG